MLLVALAGADRRGSRANQRDPAGRAECDLQPGSRQPTRGGASVQLVPMQAPPPGSTALAWAGATDMRVAIPAAASPDAIRVAMRAMSISP